MSESDRSARATFDAVVGQARQAGAQAYVGINGNPSDTLPDNNDPWRKVELDVSLRLPSGKLHNEDILEHAVRVSSSCLAMALALLAPEESEAATPFNASGLPEGARVRVEVNRYERSPANRAACIAHYGARCQACGFDFRNVYGELGEGYIEVHHRTPVSEMGGEYRIDLISDLIPLCGNCHAMLHRADPVMPFQALRDIIESRRKNKALISAGVV
jgi:5-methylcytosine-specific restriction protein A